MPSSMHLKQLVDADQELNLISYPMNWSSSPRDRTLGTCRMPLHLFATAGFLSSRWNLDPPLCTDRPTTIGAPSNSGLSALDLIRAQTCSRTLGGTSLKTLYALPWFFKTDFFVGDHFGLDTSVSDVLTVSQSNSKLPWTEKAPCLDTQIHPSGTNADTLTAWDAEKSCPTREWQPNADPIAPQVLRSTQDTKSRVQA